MVAPQIGDAISELHVGIGPDSLGPPQSQIEPVATLPLDLRESKAPLVRLPRIDVVGGAIIGIVGGVLAAIRAHEGLVVMRIAKPERVHPFGIRDVRPAHRSYLRTSMLNRQPLRRDLLRGIINKGAISEAFLSCGNGFVRYWDDVWNRVAHAIALSFEISEVEELILLDWSPRAGAELFQSDGRLGAWKRITGAIRIAVYVRIEVVASIPTGRPAVRVCGPVNGIGSGFNSDVNYRARLPTVFRARILLCLEFVDGIDGQHRSRVARGHDCVHHALRHPGIVAVDAVHHEEIVVGPETVGALCPAGVADVFRHAWAQVEQVLKVSAVQGEVVDDFILQRSTEFSVGGFHQRDLFGNGNGLRLLARLE